MEKFKKDKCPVTGCSVSSKLARLTPENFEIFFKEKCKKDKRKWQDVYRGIGGVIPQKPK